MKCRDGDLPEFSPGPPLLQHPANLPRWESIQVTRQTIKKLIAEIGELKNEVPLLFSVLKITMF